MFPDQSQHRLPMNLYPSSLKNIHTENQKRLLQRCWFSRWLPDSCTSVNSSTGFKACFFPKLGDKNREQTGQQTNRGASNPIITILHRGTATIPDLRQKQLCDDVHVNSAGAGGDCGGVARVLRVLQYLLVVAVCGRIPHRRRSRRRRGGGGRRGGSS